jgi:crossover junction endodeoxyribonuclease RuvC
VLVLGVDPGSTVTGFGLVEQISGKLIHCHDEQLKLPARADVGKKLALLYDRTADLLERYKPEQVAFEGIFFGSNVKSMLVLGQARGAVMVAAARYGLKIFEYPPATVKQTVAGYGNAAKDQIQHMVKLLLKVEEVSGEHAADALAVAICHHHQTRLQGWPSA